MLTAHDQAIIAEAMKRANPEVEGDLMRWIERLLVELAETQKHLAAVLEASIAASDEPRRLAAKVEQLEIELIEERSRTFRALKPL